MRKFARKRGMITTSLSAYEVELLTSLVKQLVELVSDGEPGGFAARPEPTDAFEALVADLQVAPDEPEISEDPVLKRLFPSAYPEDTAAASDFRRFTERDLRAQKVAEAQVVLDRLEATDLGAHDLKIPRERGRGVAAHPDQRSAGGGDPARDHRRGDRGDAGRPARGRPAVVPGQRLRLARVRPGDDGQRTMTQEEVRWRAYGVNDAAVKRCRGADRRPAVRAEQRLG